MLHIESRSYNNPTLRPFTCGEDSTLLRAGKNQCALSAKNKKILIQIQDPALLAMIFGMVVGALLTARPSEGKTSELEDPRSSTLLTLDIVVGTNLYIGTGDSSKMTKVKAFLQLYEKDDPSISLHELFMGLSSV
eukprot:scaffold121_cov356-Pavlova_lutheri.AAC.10